MKDEAMNARRTAKKSLSERVPYKSVPVVCTTKGQRMLYDLVTSKRLMHFVNAYNTAVAEYYGVNVDDVTKVHRRPGSDALVPSQNPEYRNYRLDYSYLNQIAKNGRPSDNYKILLADERFSPHPIKIEDWEDEGDQKRVVYLQSTAQARLYKMLQEGTLVEALQALPGIHEGDLSTVLRFVMGTDREVHDTLKKVLLPLVPINEWDRDQVSEEMGSLDEEDMAL